MKLIFCAVIFLTPLSLLASPITNQQATGACMLFIKQILHDPKSSEFDHSKDAAVIVKADRAMVIRSVRAKNGFGALRHTEFMCLMESRGDTLIPVLVTEKSQRTAEAAALLKKWKLLD